MRAPARRSITEEQSPAKPIQLARPEHGGNLDRFCRQHGFKADEVLDLSTAISPWCWPVLEIPKHVWQSLPHRSSFSGLYESATAYYRCDKKNLLAVPGSQSAIEILPQTIARPNSLVAVPEVGYEEHAYCWQREGHRLVFYRGLEYLEALVSSANARTSDRIQYAVVINPNNPTGESYCPDRLRTVASRLAKQNGFLVVDEAFVDSTPELSLMGRQSAGLIVLRSVGKFFGLAGMRLGFVGGSEIILRQIEEKAGLWSLSSATTWLGASMLADTGWIDAQIPRINQESLWMHDWAKQRMPDLHWRACSTFVSGRGDRSLVREYQQIFARSGILVRVYQCEQCETEAILRLGLVDFEARKRVISMWGEHD